MPQATAGQEFDTGNYSFRFTGTVKDAVDFYNDTLAKAGWSTMMTIPGDEQGGLLVYQKDNQILTVTVTNMSDGSIVVLLTLA
jgi:predicted 3-demethylubiquinone-9 3-methyltransferase (glyoxalase superfamily)